MDRKILAIGILVLIGLGIFAVANLSGEQKETVDITYGGQYYPGEFLLKGKPEFWSVRDLEVEHILFSSGAENNKALVSGDVDINCGSDSKTTALFGAIPEKAVIIGTIQRGNRYATVVRKDSNYTSWEDLKGKKVATRFGTGADAILRRYYEQSDHEWEDFDYVNMKIEDMINALEAGRIEAFTAWEPTPSIAEAQGAGRVMRTYGDIALVPASIHTTRKFARNNPDKVARFLAAQMDKAEMINENPEEAAQIASQAAAQKGIDVSPDAFERVFERINFQVSFNKTIVDEIRNTAQFLEEQGKIEEVPEFYWNTTYLEEAKKLREE
jgi:ABC-type nitrate/sulfonate/bicarbonate transport system substrate-binding protein